MLFWNKTVCRCSIIFIVTMVLVYDLALYPHSFFFAEKMGLYNCIQPKHWWPILNLNSKSSTWQYFLFSKLHEVCFESVTNGISHAFFHMIEPFHSSNCIIAASVLLPQCVEKRKTAEKNDYKTCHYWPLTVSQDLACIFCSQPSP